MHIYNKDLKMIKLLELLKEREELPNGVQVHYFRAVDSREMELATKTGTLPYYSKDPMSNDWEVVELSMQENDYEGDPEQYVDQIVPWIDKSRGVNITTDFDNAVGYNDYVLALDIQGPYVEFTRSHIFAKDPKQVKVIGVYDVKQRQWINLAYK